MDSLTFSSSVSPSPNSSLSMKVFFQDGDGDSYDYYYFYSYLYTYKSPPLLALRILTYFVGCVGNIVIIRTFLRMGLNDGVVIVFFNLAIADLNLINTYLVVILTELLEYIPQNVLFNFKVHPYTINMICLCVFQFTFSYAVSFLTTLLSVQRCLCIVKPLHFNQIMTRSRTLVLVALSWTLSLAYSFIAFGFLYPVKQRVPYNKTWITLGLSEHWSDYIYYFDVMEIVLVRVPCQVSVVVCIVIMAGALARSVRFRQTSSIADSGANKNNEDVKETKDKDQIQKSTKAGGSTSNTKERMVIIQVSIVAVVFIASNCGPYIYKLLMLIPDIKNYFGYHDAGYNRYMVYIQTNILFKMINSSVNVFVYYRYNTKFRQLCFK